MKRNVNHEAVLDFLFLIFDFSEVHEGFSQFV